MSVNEAFYPMLGTGSTMKAVYTVVPTKSDSDVLFTIIVK